MAKTADKKAFLDKVSREVPEYAEVLALFRELYAVIDGREGETGIAFALSGRSAAERVRLGLPLLSAESLSVDREKALGFIGRVIDVMVRVGKDADEGLERLRAALGDGTLDLLLLLRACMDRDRKTVMAAATAVRIEPALLAFALETPLRTALEQEAQGLAPALVEGWQGDSCPVCGSPPAMAELVGEEGRFLSCSACFHRWPYKLLGCPACGNEEPDQLTYFTADDGPVRVDLCLACARYMKTRDSRKGNADVPLEAEHLATVHLDLAAAREGYGRGV